MSYQTRAMAERYINAAKDGYLDVLQHATKRDLNTTDEDGMTAVMWAAHNGHLDALRLIVGRGGDVDRCDYLGLTPLHHASQRGLLHIVTYLVNWGANIYALDNDHHSALDLASLYERVEVVQYLDTVYAQQQTKNPKHVARLKEEALKQAERNVRRYEKLQEEAARRAQKEQKKLSASVSGPDAGQNGGVQAASNRKQNFLKTLTLAIRGTKAPRKTSASSGKTYSVIAGLSQTTRARGGVAKRINRREVNGTGGGDDADFKISDVDESGKRTLRSLSAAQGVRSLTSDVMYLTGQRGDSAASADISTSRPAAYEVFGGNSRATVFKAKSESDLLDSGVDSILGDDDDDENAPGIFNRPGFGKTAFLTGTNFLNTLQSFDTELDGGGGGGGGGGDVGAAARSSLNGFPPQLNGDIGASEAAHDVLGEDAGGSWRGPKELPWDQEEVDTLDDDDEGGTSSALEMFLWSAGLEGYLHKFLQEKVDMDVLVKMTDMDLKEIGVPFGPRKRLLEAIKRRQDVLSLPKHMTDSFL